MEGIYQGTDGCFPTDPNNLNINWLPSKQHVCFVHINELHMLHEKVGVSIRDTREGSGSKWLPHKDSM